MSHGFLWTFLIAFAGVLATGIRLVKDGTRLGVFRLGKFTRVSGPNIALLIPFIDSSILVDLKQTIPDWYAGFPEELLKERVKAHLLRSQSSLRGETSGMVSSSPELKAFVDWLVFQASSRTNIPLQRDQLVVNRFEAAAVQAEEAFRKVDTFEICLPFLTTDSSGPKHFQMRVSKSDFLRFK